MDLNSQPDNSQNLNQPSHPSGDPGATISPTTPAAPINPVMDQTVTPPTEDLLEAAPEVQPLSGVTAPMPKTDPSSQINPAAGTLSGVYPEQAPLGKPAAFMDPNHQPETAISGSGLKNGKKKMLKILMVALVVLFVGGGAGVYAFVSMQKNKPENITAESIGNIFAEKQMALDGTLNVKQSDAKLTSDITFGMKADSAAKAYEFTMGVGKLESDAFKLNDTKFGASIRIIKDNGYFRIDNLKKFIDGAYDAAGKTLGDPTLLDQYKPVKAQLDTLADKISDKWVQFPTDSLKSDGKDCTDTVMGVTESDQKAIGGAYKKNSFMTLKSNHGSEALDGVQNLHYTVSLDQKKADAFGNDFANLEFVKNINKCLNNTTTTDTSHSATTSDTSTTKLGDIDYWITKSGHKLSRVTVPISDDSTKVTATTDMKLSYGQAVKVDIPAGAMSWKDFSALLEKAVKDSNLLPSLDSGSGDSPLGIVNGLKTDIPNIVQTN